MRIAVVGMGNVGGVLGRRFAEAGHNVVFCVRDPDDPKKRRQAEDAQASIGPVSAAHEAEAVLLAVPWGAVPAALKDAGDLSGKVLLDCTNPVTPELTHLTIGHTTSAGEEVGRMAPGARVVKIFNTNGAKNMADPDYGGHKVTMLYAGDDDGANCLAAGLAAEIGFEPIYLGPLKESRLLEPMAMAWIVLARQRGLGRDFALDVVRRKDGGRPLPPAPSLSRRSRFRFPPQSRRPPFLSPFPPFKQGFAKMVKIFNTNGAKNMADLDYGGHEATMLYAGE